MTLRLLIDTCVWLDLAKDHRQLPLLEALLTMTNSNEAVLIMPELVMEEFGRNKERVIADNKRSLSTHFKRVRDAIAQFAPEAERDDALTRLDDVDHKIAISGEATSEGVDIVGTMFASATAIALTDSVKSRAADRAIGKLAPFHRQKNGIADAILIEIYADAVANRTNDEDVYAFITHNVHDFSERGADARLPHADIATLFDGQGSRYATALGPLIGEFAEELLEDIKFDREFVDQPRGLSELVEAAKFLDRQVWYNRHWNLRFAIESGKHKLVTNEEWNAAGREAWQTMTVDTVWERALVAAAKVEEELGIENLGPWDDFEWGMVNGKLSAIRWALGDEWDMLDT
jgi:hypothetical protein